MPTARKVLLPLVALALGFSAAMAVAPHPRDVSAQTIIYCAGSSQGNGFIYGSQTACPVPVNIVTTSSLYKYDPYSFDYYFVNSTFSGCGFCQFDWASSGHTGSSGDYYTYGQHSVSGPGYVPGFGFSFWYFTV